MFSPARSKKVIELFNFQYCRQGSHKYIRENCIFFINLEEKSARVFCIFFIYVINKIMSKYRFCKTCYNVLRKLVRRSKPLENINENKILIFTLVFHESTQTVELVTAIQWLKVYSEEVLHCKP